MRNPFKYGGIVTGPHFADRSAELDELSREIENRNRVFLISPRRLGKTCLLHNLIHGSTSNQTAFAYVDLNAFPDLRALAGALTGRTTRALESNTERLLKLFAGFRRLRPRIELDPEGRVRAGLEVATEEKEALAAVIEGLAHAEALAAKKGKTLVVIIDEFSDIAKYNGGTVEKALRAEIQRHQHISYIFAGSEASVMLAMVQNKKRPFYKMGRIMAMGSIQAEAYEAFIRSWFDKGRYVISSASTQRMIALGAGITYNVQRLCHMAWEAAIESKSIDGELIESLPLMIAEQDAPHYETLWQSISGVQKELLIALAKDPETPPFSKAFQLRHRIGPSSSINASLTSLIKKGVLAKTGKGAQISFVDLFLLYWIRDLRAMG